MQFFHSRCQTSMLERPRFAPHLHVHLIPPHDLVLTGGMLKTRMPHPLWPVIVPMIDGAHTVDDIVDAVIERQPGTDPTAVYTLLFQLEQKGYLEENATDVPTSLAAVATSVGVRTSQVSEKVLNRTVHVVSIGNVDVATLKDGLLRSGLHTTDDANRADVTIVVTDDYLNPGLDAVNRDHLQRKKPWILVRPNGLDPMVGPLIVPGATACWECLAERQRHNRDLDMFLGQHAPEHFPFPERVELPGFMDLATGRIASALTLWFLTDRSPLLGTILSMDMIGGDQHRHTVVRRPQCPACGQGASILHGPDRVELAPSPRMSATDAGYRSSTPELIYEKYRHHVSHVSGVVSMLERITDPSDAVQHVYLSGQNMATKYGSFDNLRRELRSASCGKGTTDIQARVSGLCEAIERYSGVYRGDEYVREATMDELGTEALHPNDLMRFSDRQFDERNVWMERDHKFAMVPYRMDPTMRMSWSPVWSLTNDCPRWLPTGQLYYSYPKAANEFYYIPDSNGASTGATREEAILQGFLELVERDAVATWWYNRTRQPGVDLASYDDPYVHAMRKRQHELGRELWVLDITNDLGLPVFMAFSRDVNGPRENITFAPGAHIDPRIALLRALTELNQMMPGIQPGPNGQEYAFDDPQAIDWWRTATVANQPYIVPDAQLAATKREEYSVPQTTDLREDIMMARDIVERRGLEFLVHDQTRPDVGMPVVKVIVPGLRHFWARFAPGRLYDVPVVTGRLAAPTAETDLNPIAMFI